MSSRESAKVAANRVESNLDPSASTIVKKPDLSTGVSVFLRLRAVINTATTQLSEPLQESTKQRLLLDVRARCSLVGAWMNMD